VAVLSQQIKLITVSFPTHTLIHVPLSWVIHMGPVAGLKAQPADTCG